MNKGLLTCHLCGIVIYGSGMTWFEHWCDSHMDLEAERVRS